MSTRTSIACWRLWTKPPPRPIAQPAALYRRPHWRRGRESDRQPRQGGRAKYRLMDPLTAKAAIYALATLETNAKHGHHRGHAHSGLLRRAARRASGYARYAGLHPRRAARGHLDSSCRGLRHRPQRQRIGRRGRMPSRSGERRCHGSGCGRRHGARHTDRRRSTPPQTSSSRF